MQQTSWEIARNNYKNNPICRKGLTPFILITNGVVDYIDWLEALQYSPDAADDIYSNYKHRTSGTNFGKKILAFAKAMGYSDYCFTWKFNKRSTDCHLESIKLINVTISLIFEQED